MRRANHLLMWLGVLVLAASCKPTGTGGDAGVMGPDCAPPVTLGTGLRLLTRAEYNHTVRDLLGDTSGPAVDFPREPLANGLDNNAALLRVSADGVARYLEAAESLSTATVTARRAKLVTCTSNDIACGNDFIDTFGVRAFRRPLNNDERADLRTLFATAMATSDFDAALTLTTQVMLQAPQFLYRDEQALGPVPKASVALGGYELATRLSYFVWATTPDDELLTAAANGVLDSEDGLTAQAQRLLADPRADDGLMRFFSLWLYLDGVQNTEKNTDIYPQYTHALAGAWRRSVELYLLDTLHKDGTLKALLSSNALFTNADMPMYGPTATDANFVRTDMSDTQRHGLLTQPGFLAFKALPDGSSPIRRGVFVLNNLICQPPPPPPAGVPITPPLPSTSKTTRERFGNHSTDPTCHACHQFIDPPGFTFEHYDGLGRWRDEENGQPIDSTGGIVTAHDTELLQNVDDVIGLETVLANSQQVHDCLAKSVYQFALGRELTKADTCTVTQLGSSFMSSGGNFKALMLAVIQSRAFRENANPEMTP